MPRPLISEKVTPAATRFFSFYKSEQSFLLRNNNHKGEGKGRNHFPNNPPREDVSVIRLHKKFEKKILHSPALQVASLNDRLLEAFTLAFT